MFKKKIFENRQEIDNFLDGKVLSYTIDGNTLLYKHLEINGEVVTTAEELVLEKGKEEKKKEILSQFSLSDQLNAGRIAALAIYSVLTDEQKAAIDDNFPGVAESLLAANTTIEEVINRPIEQETTEE